MKKLLLALLSLFILASCENKPETNLQITGVVKGLQKGTLYLKKMGDSSFITLDSMKIDGKSEFESNIDLKSPEMLYLFLDRGETKSGDDNLMFFAEPGKINIATDLEYFYSKAVITGSKNNELYENYKKITSKYNEQQLELTVAKINALKSKQMDLIASIEEKSNAITKRKYLYAINFAVTNKDYEVAPYIALSEINDATVKYLDTIQKSMSPKVAKSRYGVLLSKYVGERKKE
ncbi:MAG: DUF4369 domain-containing protein [Flavobacterium sp.]|nr:DUF4369 domain-containing protein [Flavobacterium sp.]